MEQIQQKKMKILNFLQRNTNNMKKYNVCQFLQQKKNMRNWNRCIRFGGMN